MIRGLPQAGGDAVAAERHHHLEEARRHRLAGERDSRGVDQHSRFHRPFLSQTPQRALRFVQAERLKARETPGEFVQQSGKRAILPELLHGFWVVGKIVGEEGAAPSAEVLDGARPRLQQVR